MDDHSMFSELASYYDACGTKGVAQETFIANDPYFGISLAPAMTEEQYLDPRSTVMEQATSYDTLGGLSPDLEEMINGILPEKDLPVGEMDLSVANINQDLNAMSLWSDDSLDLDNMDPNEMLSGGGVTDFPGGLTPLKPQEETRIRNKDRKSSRRTRNEPQVPTCSLVLPNMQCPYPPPEELGVASPAYSQSDSASGDEGSKPRQRRARVQYNTLTEEEKYQRIRDLNNEASRQYRIRNRQQLSKLQQQLEKLQERNQVLQHKHTGLEQLRNQIRDYTNGILRKHMSSTQPSQY
nr:uncharacterized protein LOC128688144 [Cherax quadricarinatus]